MNGSPEASSSPAHFGPQEDQSHLPVLISGLVTTVLALLGVYLLDLGRSGFHIMGWYANYILPVGAVLVGVVASSGYGLASWFRGIKITRSLLWLVLLFQLLSYFGAQYIEFRSLRLIHRDGRVVGFFEYFDLAARSFAWKQDNGSMGQPLGMWGYAFRGLEIAGFAAGGLIVPVLLRKAPYCQACQRYMRTRQLAVLPASVPARKVKKSDTAGTAAYEAEQEQAFESGKQRWEQLRQLAMDSKAADFRSALAELDPEKKRAMKLPRRFSLKLVSCGRCHSGWLHLHLLSGQGKKLKQTEFARTDVQPEFVQLAQAKQPDAIGRA